MRGAGGWGRAAPPGREGEAPPHERCSLLLVLNEALGHQVGDLHRQPWTQLWGDTVSSPPGHHPPPIRRGWDTGTPPTPPAPHTLTPSAMR